MKSMSYLLATLVGSLATSPLLAAEKSPPSPSAPEIARVTLHPMAETRPALKYQLLPPLLDCRSGNAAVWWNVLLACNGDLVAELGKRETAAKINRWMTMPIGDQHEKEFRAKEPIVDKILESDIFAKFDYAARFDSCDWEFPRGNWDILNLGNAELRARNRWGLMLAAKAHWEIAEKKYEQALHTVQTGLALARHLGQCRKFISAVLGGVIARSVIDQVEQLIQQPDAPNLYWSLVMLPQPLIDYHTSFETEMKNVYFAMPYLQGLEKKSLSKEQWDELLARLLADCAKLHIDVPAARITEGYPRARQYLVDHGRKPAEVEAMPRSQVVLLFTVGFYQELSDEQYKIWFLPYREMAAAYQRPQAKLREAFRDEIVPLASANQVALFDLKRAEMRVPFIVAKLRVFEALRVYAAAHDGQLPQQLTDINEVPVPVNPYDGKPFSYHRDGSRAQLSVEHGPWAEPWRCEIIMAAKDK
jgi:hypothetical protein